MRKSAHADARGPGRRVGACLVLLMFAAATPISAREAEDPAATVPITFMVTAPASSPPGTVLWISGDHPMLGAWSGAGVRLSPDGSGRHVGTVRLPPMTPVAFKVTRGSWEAVEKGSSGEEIPNRSWSVSQADGTGRPDTLRFTVASWRDQVESRPRVTTRSGDVRIHPSFPSRLVRARDVLVYLPPGYAADTVRRYPVIYFHDGQNVFDAATSFLGVE